MNPWKRFLSTMTIIGSVLSSATAFATTLTPLPAVYDPATKVVTIGVYVLGSNERVGAASVVFSESDATLGTVDRLGNNGISSCDVPRLPACTVRLRLAPGYALGPHTITASYSGSDARGGVVENAPASLTFTIYVSDSSWLPAVLDDLLSD